MVGIIKEAFHVSNCSLGEFGGNDVSADEEDRKEVSLTVFQQINELTNPIEVKDVFRSK